MYILYILMGYAYLYKRHIYLSQRTAVRTCDESTLHCKIKKKTRTIEDNFAKIEDKFSTNEKIWSAIELIHVYNVCVAIQTVIKVSISTRYFDMSSAFPPVQRSEYFHENLLSFISIPRQKKCVRHKIDIKNFMASVWLSSLS